MSSIASRHSASTRTSIAICTHNGEPFIQDQLDSIFSQTVRPDEIILCDDRSSDRTVELLQPYIEQNEIEVRLEINTDRLGSTRNFEKAIRKCSGEFIFLADQDDVWRPDKVEIILRTFARSENIGLVFSDADVVKASLRPTGKRLWSTVGLGARQRQMITDGHAFDVLVRTHLVTGAAMALRRTYSDLIYPIPHQWVHDGWIALQIAAVADIALVEEPLIRYRQHDTQQIGTEVGVRGRLRGIRSRNAGYWLEEALRFEFALRHLKKRDAAYHAEHIEVLTEKVEHCRMRSRVSSAQSRTPAIEVAREARSGRYSRFSGGWRSILKDLLLPAR